MKRRELLTALGGAMVWPLAAHAQQPKQQPRKIPRVGVLWHAGSPEEEDVYLRVLTKAFNDLGYIEGKTIDLEHRFPAEQPERFRSFARELVESKVDAIIAVTALGAKEAQALGLNIPTSLLINADEVIE
jgi:putative ABC transport system substrate-binding protein